MSITFTPVVAGPDFQLLQLLKPTLNVYVLLQTTPLARGPFLIAPSLKKIRRAYRQAPGSGLTVYFFTKGAVFLVSNFIRVKV